MEAKPPKLKASGKKITLLVASLVTGVMFFYPLQIHKTIFFILGNFTDYLSYGDGAMAIINFIFALVLPCILLAAVTGVVSYWKGGVWLKVTWIAALISIARQVLGYLMAMIIMQQTPWEYFSLPGVILTLLCLAVLVVMMITAINLGKQTPSMMSTLSTQASDAVPASLFAEGHGGAASGLQQAPATKAPKAGFFWVLFSDRGRINRGQFWGYSFLAIFLYLLIAGGSMAVTAPSQEEDIRWGLLPFIIILAASLMLVWNSLALTIKRYHDLDKSAWWLLIAFIPLIGSLWQFIETGFVAGTPGPNRYGPKP